MTTVRLGYCLEIDNTYVWHGHFVVRNVAYVSQEKFNEKVSEITWEKELFVMSRRQFTVRMCI